MSKERQMVIDLMKEMPETQIIDVLTYIIRKYINDPYAEDIDMSDFYQPMSEEEFRTKLDRADQDYREGRYITGTDSVRVLREKYGLCGL